ncbi:MAG: hypothetical protein ACLGH7_00545 [Actinomycetes bacterium]
MGTIFGTALSLMLTVGGAAVAAEGGPGAARNYLTGHVLLGLGIGLLAATVLRTAGRILLARRATPLPESFSPAATEPAALPAEFPAARVTVLPVGTAPAVPLRGRHAA